MRKFNKLGLLCVAVLLAAVLSVTASFSWFTRPDGNTTAHALTLKSDDNKEMTAVIKSQDCQAKTYASKMNNGLLTLDTEEVKITEDKFEIPAKKVQYFTTKVENKASSKTNISLTNLSLNGATNAYINLLNPLKTTMKYDDTQSGITFAQHLTVAAESTLNVEWYIYNPGTSAITVYFENLPEISYSK